MDDTWNSSYKILENLSRTDDNSSKQHGTICSLAPQPGGTFLFLAERIDPHAFLTHILGEADDDEDPDEPKSARKASRKHTAAKTIEKNLNNINLKNYELEFEADPLFHKVRFCYAIERCCLMRDSDLTGLYPASSCNASMLSQMSQSFDEGGAKGMLLANLGLYDGCKILLNSSDVGVSTRKPIAMEKEAEDEQEEPKVKKEVSDPNKRISLSSFGTLACFTDDVQVRRTVMHEESLDSTNNVNLCISCTDI